MPASFLALAFAALFTPAPLPDRWLLTLTPADLPKLPDPFWKTTWVETSPEHGNRVLKPEKLWTEWTTFTPGNGPHAGEFAVVRLHDMKRMEVTRRAGPMAVHGPLVEYNQKLSTAAVVEGKREGGKPTASLLLGVAVEVKPNVFYQAYSEEFADQKGRVTEVLVEFADDPRKNEKGKAKVRQTIRDRDEREAERYESEGEFTPDKGRYGGPAVFVSFSTRGVLFELPRDGWPGRFGMHTPWKNLPATADDPPPVTPPPGLVQPPAKPK